LAFLAYFKNKNPVFIGVSEGRFFGISDLLQKMMKDLTFIKN